MNQNADACLLVVDDEVGVTRLCKRFLTRAGYDVITANHPQEGLNYLQNQPISLLLVDIRMPEMDGFQLLKLARQFQDDVAVVIMTGYGTVETAVESLHRGADGMILKPFSGAELVQSVEQALRDRQREREVVRLQALRPLFDISESLFAEKSPERLRNRLLVIVSEHLQCSHISFYSRDLKTKTWQQLATLGIQLDLDDQWPEQWSLLDEMCSTTLPEITDSALARKFQDLDLGNFICIPLNTENQRQVLFAARDLGANPFGEVELETLRILSRQAIVALENARLYDELQERIRQVEASQQALVQAEKMAAVGRLTASIAHEINNPLHSIRNCLHLAGREELSVEDQREYLQMASDEMERLMHTVRQMLDFYRPSALDRKPSDINELIDGVLNLLEKQLRDNNTSVHCDFAEGLPLVLTVKNQIQQVLFNLLLNAMEAMPSGGEIYITTIEEPDGVSVFVEDTGAGISGEIRTEIFEPFVSSKEQGLGLGLTVSYGVVTAHEGSLILLPPGDRGACFRLTLPIYSPK